MTRESPGGQYTRALNVGEIIISRDKEEIVWTVLGSCVSVVFHVNEKLSIICHAQMPFRKNINDKCYEQCPNPCYTILSDSIDNKFVKCSVEFMVQYLVKHKCNFSKLNTTLIGGATILKKINDKATIGELNIKIAKDILNKNGIKINRELVGGLNGYTLWYYTNSDRLFVRIHHDKKEKFELINNR